jgi:hypothetical protein
MLIEEEQEQHIANLKNERHAYKKKRLIKLTSTPSRKRMTL